MSKKTMSFGASLNYRKQLAHPERTAIRSVGWDVQFQTWTNRKAMAKTIRMQESRMPKSGDWKAVVALADGEGF